MSFKWLTVYDIKSVFKISENIPETDIDVAVTDAYNFDVITSLPDSLMDAIKVWLMINPIQWNSSTSYVVGDKVFYNGVYYLCAANNSNSQPSSTNVNWEVSELMNFWSGYVKPYFIACAYSRFFLWHGANVTQYGITEVIGEERQSISSQKKAELLADVGNKIDVFLARLTKANSTANYTFDGVTYDLDCGDTSKLDSHVRIWVQKGKCKNINGNITWL